MINAIYQKLGEIEQTKNVKILLAVESGSRAWGFASPDSDYDVRFIYVHPKDWYLALQKKRDVINICLDDVLDINGWDFDKTLRLLHASNPTLFEWLQSPIVYRKHPFIQKLLDITGEYFLENAGLHHYLNMAEGNYREYLKGETVRRKKYFYVLRPILACRHILQNHTPPPMEFEKLLYAQMDAGIVPAVEKLLEEKRNAPETGEGAKIPELNRYIEENIVSLKREISQLPPQKKKPWDGLNQLFLQSLEI